MRLLQQTDGKLYLEGENVFEASKEKKNDYCRKMQIIFQDPYSSLNPRKTIRSILSEAYIVQKLCPKEEIEGKIRELCDIVGISQRLLDYYPHELDGGTRQVVGIARALSLNPKFIVCDEPVSSLDVSIQAQVLNLLKELQSEYGLTYLFITHDLSVVKYFSDKIAVMYLGQLVETAEADELFRNTLHPYSKALLSAIPEPKAHKKMQRVKLMGELTSPIDPQVGCRFAKRCLYSCEGCTGVDPELKEYGRSHFCSCFRTEELKDV